MTNEARFFLFTLFEVGFFAALLCYGYYVYPRVTIKCEVALIGVFVIATVASNIVIRFSSNRLDQSDLPNRARNVLRVVSALVVTSLAFLLGFFFVSVAGIISASLSSVVKLSLMAGLGVGAAGLAGLFLSGHERFGFPVRFKGDPPVSDEKSADGFQSGN